MRTILAGGQVYDGTGAAPQPADVVVEDDRIVEVGTGLDGDTMIDMTGQTILPGLIDAHVHVMFSGMNPTTIAEEPFSYAFYKAGRNLRTLLRLGITTVRDAGGADLGTRQAVADGLIDGSDLVISVTPLSQTGGHVDGWTVHGEVRALLVPHPGRPDTVVDGRDEMRRRVREIVRAGADFIKICTSGGVMSMRDDPRHPQFSEEELAVCVAEAAAAGLDVMAHAQGTPGIKNAVLAGVRSIEHGIYLDDECIELMLERGTWLVPTLLAPVALIRMIEAGAPLPQPVIDKAYAVTAAHKEAISRAVAAGVKIAMGTDSGVFPHGANVEELELMVEAGMSPAQALAASTTSGAGLLGLGEVTGRIAPGYRADLVVVDGDPDDFATHAERVRYVMKHGVFRRSPDMSVERVAVAP